MFSVKQDNSQHTTQTGVLPQESNKASVLPLEINQTNNSSSPISKARENIALAKAALSEAVSEYNNLISILYFLREDTFEYANKGTSSIYKKLKDGVTTQQRDAYINKLIEFNTLRTELQKLSDENIFFSMSQLAYIHHTSFVFGDLKALNDRRPAPDFRNYSGE